MNAISHQSVSTSIVQSAEKGKEKEIENRNSHENTDRRIDVPNETSYIIDRGRNPNSSVAQILLNVEAFK